MPPSSALTLRVITPDAIVLDTTADSVRIPGVDGSLGVLPRHAPMVAALDAGILEYKAGGTKRGLFVSDGFAEVRDNTLRVVCEAGEVPEAIDEERARAAEARARKRLSGAGDEGASDRIDLLRAQAALRRALMRLRVYGSGGPGA